MMQGSGERAALGPIGVVLGDDDWEDTLAAAPELEELGYRTIWLPGPHLDNLDRVLEMARATRAVPISTAVIAADLFGAEAVARLYRTMEAEHPGRFIAGIGGAHGPRPLQTLSEFLDRLDTDAPVPVRSRLLSALGPRMLDLAAQRTLGAMPVLATPEYTGQARVRLGPNATLVIEQFVALDTDAARARDAARRMVAFLRDVEGGYARHFRRTGFTEDEIARLDDRLIDALVACGDLDTVVRRVEEQRTAGADQVALYAIPTGAAPSHRQRQLLGEALISPS